MMQHCMKARPNMAKSWQTKQKHGKYGTTWQKHRDVIAWAPGSAMALTDARAQDLRLAGEAKLAANVRGKRFAALRLRLARAADVPVGAGGRGVGPHQGYAGAGGQADGRAVTQTHQETWPDEAQT